MGNFTENDYAFASRFKSHRRKKRIVKKDFDKQLLSVFERERELFNAKKDLPLVPLEIPYQQGWVRFFVLREDVLRSPQAKFFENLLMKINTYNYSNAKSFSRRVKKKGKRVLVKEHQELYRVYPHQWNCPKFGLTDKEKGYFTYVEKKSTTFGRVRVHSYYVFTESWRYVLRVKPYYVTHRKAIDAEIESELGWIENKIMNFHLRGKIDKLKRGYNRYRYYDEDEKPRYCNPYKNKSLQEFYEDYVDEKRIDYGK
ncbi:hypothetical protein [Flavobacterium sp. NRK F7]|uniref:hypothetical protein n=1 Tax=Flavobacterium sp. NRK F7 TaxID=2954930 RepID=UPI002090833C|nr:hypothetical protein [Flavobacterium sp. NRK F7]MCO6162789.1 hypothetical protein [Flavobacterium sp. NRK F7]